MSSTTTDRRLGLTGSAAIKVPCKAATTANITLSAAQTIDGVSCVSGDRVLVRSQTSSAENGIYVVDTGTWTRDLDFDGVADVVTGTIVMVLNGSTNANTYWRLATTGTVTFGTSAITFAAALAGDSAMVTFLPSGTGGVADTVANKLGYNCLSPLDYMTTAQRADVTGLAPTLDHTSAISTAITRAVAQGKYVDLGGYIWLLKSQLAITLNGSRLRLGGATIKKGFSGDLIAVSANDFTLDGVGTIDGQHGTFTGRGVVISSGTRPYFAPGIVFTSFTDSHIRFEIDAGYSAKIYCDFAPGSGQTDYRAVHIAGPDTLSRHRKIIGSTALGGYHDFNGSWDTGVVNSAFNRIQIDANCQLTHVLGCFWGNSNSPMTISGLTCAIVGNRFSGAVTLVAGSAGTWTGNYFTFGSLTDSTDPAGLSWAIHHKEGGANTAKLSRAILVSNSPYTDEGGSIQVANQTTPAKWLQLGYDGTADVAYLKALHSGTANKDLALQPVANAVLIGQVTSDGASKLQVAGSALAASATAIPAGGTAGMGYKVSSTSNFGVFFGSGAPTLSAAKGSLYLRSNGTTTNDRMYVNTDGGTTWTAVTTAA